MKAIDDVQIRGAQNTFRFHQQGHYTHWMCVKDIEQADTWADTVVALGKPGEVQRSGETKCTHKFSTLDYPWNQMDTDSLTQPSDLQQTTNSSKCDQCLHNKANKDTYHSNLACALNHPNQDGDTCISSGSKKSCESPDIGGTWCPPMPTPTPVCTEVDGEVWDDWKGHGGRAKCADCGQARTDSSTGCKLNVPDGPWDEPCYTKAQIDAGSTATPQGCIHHNHRPTSTDSPTIDVKNTCGFDENGVCRYARPIPTLNSFVTV